MKLTKIKVVGGVSVVPKSNAGDTEEWKIVGKRSKLSEGEKHGSNSRMFARLSSRNGDESFDTCNTTLASVFPDDIDPMKHSESKTYASVVKNGTGQSVKTSKPILLTKKDEEVKMLLGSQKGTTIQVQSDGDSTSKVSDSICI